MVVDYLDGDKVMLTITQKVELFNSAYKLVREHYKNKEGIEKSPSSEKINRAVRNSIARGATDPIVVAADAIKDINANS
jgi:hypothetical protein